MSKYAGSVKEAAFLTSRILEPPYCASSLCVHNSCASTLRHHPLPLLCMSTLCRFFNSYNMGGKTISNLPNEDDICYFPLTKIIK